MALIKCPECGREKVSDNAGACPECGFGIRDYIEKEREKADEAKKAKEKSQRELANKKDQINKLTHGFNIRLDNLEKSKPNKKLWKKISFICVIIIGSIICLIIPLGLFLSFALAYSDDEILMITAPATCFLLLLLVPILITKIVADRKIKTVKHWEEIIKKQKEQLQKEYDKNVDNILKYGNLMCVDKTAFEKNNNVTTNKYTPKCPICGSPNIKRLSVVNRAASLFAFGFASAKVGKQFECENCEYRW